MNLHALIDDLLTSGVTLADPQRIRKLRVLNTLHLVVMIGAPILGLFFFSVGAAALFYVSVMVGLLMAASLLLLRKTKNLALMGNYAVAVLWVLIFLVSWNTGGITYEGVPNPSWMLKACLVLLSVFLTGYIYGTIWTVLAFFEIGLMVYLYQIRFQFPNLIPFETAALYHLGTFLVGFLLLVLMAFLFEKDKDDALAGEQTKARAFRESRRIIDEILERSPIPTFVIDRNHRLVQWNPACQKLSGLSGGNMLGKGVWDGFALRNGRSLADLVLDDPGGIDVQFPRSILSRSENGWFQLDVFLPRLKGGRQAVIAAGPMKDEKGAVVGAMQTVSVRAEPHRETARRG